MTKDLIAGGWSRQPDSAVAQAIETFKLIRLGWLGFENLDWVQRLMQKHPLLRLISKQSSVIHGVMLEELTVVVSTASTADRKLIQDYFVGKLALEELSCRMSGAGAGACDKKAAFMQIFFCLQNS